MCYLGAVSAPSWVDDISCSSCLVLVWDTIVSDSHDLSGIFPWSHYQKYSRLKNVTLLHHTQQLLHTFKKEVEIASSSESSDKFK